MNREQRRHGNGKPGIALPPGVMQALQQQANQPKANVQIAAPMNDAQLIALVASHIYGLDEQTSTAEGACIVAGDITYHAIRAAEAMGVRVGYERLDKENERRAGTGEPTISDKEAGLPERGTKPILSE